MSRRVPASLRSQVFARAQGLCEYCLMHESDTFLGFQIEHVISEKHGGRTAADNLAAACVFCNRYKGSDIATLSRTGNLIPLFNPRQDVWSQHFQIDRAHLTGLTEVGIGTAQLLCFNIADRISERLALIQAGRFPSAQALNRLRKQ